MSSILLSREEQGIVAFKIMRGMNYRTRLALALVLIATGLALQVGLYIGGAVAGGLWVVFPWCLLVLAGNLLLLVDGYDNSVNVGQFDPSAEWERVEPQRLRQLKVMDRRMSRWDRSVLDISNGWGCLVLAIIAVTLFLLIRVAVLERSPAALILGVNGALLLVPHWLTGIRSVLRKPKLILKIETFQRLMDDARGLLDECEVEYFMLLKGQDEKLPEDVKIRVKFPNQNPDFLGFYGQVVTNSVKGTDYPYFYVVLVARAGYGLNQVHQHYDPGHNLTAELNFQQDVEVLVIRQTTTKTSGYHTKSYDVRRIFREGLQLARPAAVQA